MGDFFVEYDGSDGCMALIYSPVKDEGNKN
jgi:hypothetical protein